MRTTAVVASQRVPVFLLKFGLFGVVVFALVYREDDIAETAMSVVPPGYRDVAEALHGQALDTLLGVYVLQGATAMATVGLAIPVFFLLGDES